MPSNIQSQRSDVTNAIATLAHAIWEREGRPAGRDLEFWLKAENYVRANRSTPDVELDRSERWEEPSAKPHPASSRRPAARKAKRREQKR